MPSNILFAERSLADDPIVVDHETIYSRLPQQHEFRLIDAITHLDCDQGHAIAYRDITRDQWWCKGHIPGNPIYPGVLMLESAAQLAAYMERYADESFKGFVGYGGVDDCKFRRTVEPTSRLWLLAKRIEARARRIVCRTQGVVDGTLVFEATVTGLLIHA